MKKSMLMYGLAMAAVICLSGCKSSPGQTTAAPSQGSEGATVVPSGADGKTTVTYWTTNRHDQEYMTKKIQEFNDSSKDIYIDYQVYADNYAQMLDLAFSTNTAPDVFQVTDYPAAFEKGYMRDIGSYLNDEYKARFGDGAFVEGINCQGDAIYSLPYTASAARLFYNQDLFDRVGIAGPPQTLDEMADAAKKVTEQLGGEGIYGFAGNFKSPASSVGRSVDAVVQKSGGTRGGYDFKEGRYDFSSYAPVLKAFREIFTNGWGFPGSESLDIDPLRTQFAAGNIAMYFSVSHAEPGVYTSQFPTEINWNCAQVPTVSGTVEGKQNLWFGGNYAAVNANCKIPDQAVEVIKYLYSDLVMGEYYSLGLGTVMIPSAIKEAAPPQTIQKMPDLAINTEDQNWPPLPVNVVVEGKDYNAVCVECMFGMTDIDGAIEDLNKRYNDAYDKTLASGQERVVYPDFDPYNQNTK